MTALAHGKGRCTGWPAGPGRRLWTRSVDSATGAASGNRSRLGDRSFPFFCRGDPRALSRVDVHTGVAEQLPFPDASFDVALAQLVVHFMADPVSGLAEMAHESPAQVDWSPHACGTTLAVAARSHCSGPAGAYLTQLDEARRDLVRTRCAQLLPPAPLEVAASAWCALARA